MAVQIAIWMPYWYELDQSIEVGVVDELAFFARSEHAVAGETRPVFAHGLLSEQRPWRWQQVRILAIRHPVLGDIARIDTEGLDYKLTMLDGRERRIEAEETPGWVYDLEARLEDQRFYVTYEAAT